MDLYELGFHAGTRDGIAELLHLQSFARDAYRYGEGAALGVVYRVAHGLAERGVPECALRRFLEGCRPCR